MFSTPVMLGSDFNLLTKSSRNLCVPIDEALLVDTTIMRESLATALLNYLLMMSDAFPDSLPVSVEELKVNEV